MTTPGNPVSPQFVGKSDLSLEHPVSPQSVGKSDLTEREGILSGGQKKGVVNGAGADIGDGHHSRCTPKVGLLLFCLTLTALIVTALLITSRQAPRGGIPRSDPPVVPPRKGGLHVLVTGGAGFIGSHATLMLMEAGHAVTVIDDLSRGNEGAINVLRALAKPRQLRFLFGNLGSAAAVNEALTKPQVDLVIHFAAIAFVGESTKYPLKYYLNISANTFRLLNGMREAGVEKLIYSSTCATYGNADTMPITEETPTRPVNPYGRAKLAAETAIRDFAHAQPSFKAVILRYFNVYGADPKGRLGEFPRPALRKEGRISTACFDAAQGYIDELVVYGTDFPTKDGTCIRDYIHVVDLVRAHMAAIPALSNPPALYNIGTGQGVSVKEFVDACKHVTGKPIKVRMQQKARPGDYAKVWADPSKIRRELNWTAKYMNVEEGLATAWRWREAHPRGYTKEDPAAAAGVKP